MIIGEILETTSDSNLVSNVVSSFYRNFHVLLALLRDNISGFMSKDTGEHHSCFLPGYSSPALETT